MQTSRRAGIALAALGLALAGMLVAGARPAQAAAVAASCSNHYFYAPVAQATAPATIRMLDGQVHGYLFAALWVKEYIDTKGRTVSCVQYHATAHVCAARGMTLDGGDISAYLSDNSTGIVGDGWNTMTIDALRDGACSADVTGVDSLAGDFAARAAVSGVGNYANTAFVLTAPYLPKGLHV